MSNSPRPALLSLLFALGLASPACAFDPPQAEPAVDAGAVTATSDIEPSATEDYNRGGIFDEVRLGGSFFYQDNDEGTEDGGAVHGQVLFDPLFEPFENRLFDIFLRPRPHAGGLVSFGGTDQIFGGLTWTLPLGPVFVEGSFGGTIHNGDLEDRDSPGLSLGCPVLFRESVGIGLYLGERWTFLASADHSSHAGLCGEQNNGLTHIGGSIGYRF